MAYLKYYFKYNNNELSLDSITCIEGEPLQEPKDFLKWYEEGDLAPPSFNECEKEAILKSESPMFMPRKVNFCVINF